MQITSKNQIQCSSLINTNSFILISNIFYALNDVFTGVAGGSIKAGEALSHGRITKEGRLLGGRCWFGESPRVLLFIPLRMQSHRDNAKTKDWPGWDRFSVQKVFPRKGKWKARHIIIIVLRLKKQFCLDLFTGTIAAAFTWVHKM